MFYVNAISLSACLDNRDYAIASILFFVPDLARDTMH
jgi:hypothetical protein